MAWTTPRTWVTGETVTAALMNTHIRDNLNFLKTNPQSAFAAASADLTLTTTETDVTGATVSITTSIANATYVAICVFDFDITAAGAAIGQGRLSVDGSIAAQEAHMRIDTSPARATTTLVQRGTVATAASHTWKLRALKTAANGTCAVRLTSSSITVLVFE